LRIVGNMKKKEWGIKVTLGEACSQPLRVRGRSGEGERLISCCDRREGRDCWESA